MQRDNATPSRESLGFQQATLTSFQFLQDFGFQVVEKNATIVRYESSAVFVNVFHGRSSYELGVEIGIRGEPATKVALFEIIHSMGKAQEEGLGHHVNFQVSSADGVRQFVPKLAKLAERYAPPYLTGGSEPYRILLAERARDRAAYENQTGFSSIRNKVEAAWHAKNYAEVRSLLEPFRDKLDEIDAKKLAYAEKHSTFKNRLWSWLGIRRG